MFSVDQICNMLKQMAAKQPAAPQGAKKKRTRRRKQQAQQARLALPAPSTSQPSAGGRRRRRRRGVRGGGTDSLVTVTHSDCAKTVSLDANGRFIDYVEIGPAGLTLARDLSKSFATYRFTSVRAEFRSFAASNVSGSLVMGWNIARKSLSTRAQVLALPSVDTAITRSVTFSWNPARFLDTDWTDCGQDVARLNVVATGDKDKPSVGEIWIHYTIQFNGTRSD